MQSVVDVLQTPHLVLQMMDRAGCTANKVIMISSIHGQMKGKSHLTIYGHMKGENHTLPYMVI